jgi:methylenetetrahydrofolate dehydrogenase (NADP+)/methenyltetrahydrofolate cyclohydrolase
MSATLLDGKACAAQVLARVKQKAEALAKKGITPGLATILVGEDPASHVYVGSKIKACGANGLASIHMPLPATISQKDLEAKIAELNRDPRVHGMIVQLPLPKGLATEPVLLAIDPAKDADGLHPANQGRWAQLKNWTEVAASKIALPCTPAGVIEILDHNKIDVAGKRAVVLGRSTLVGKPLALMLLAKDATVTVCHSRTQNLAALCREADILIAAIGQPRFVTADMVKPGAAVIDVGIHRGPEGLCGDVDFAAVKEVASSITPVPGGVGPMTVAMLLHNTVAAAEKSASE